MERALKHWVMCFRSPADDTEAENDIIERLNKVVVQVIENEENARAKLLKATRRCCSTTSGTLRHPDHAHVISSKEAKNLLSLLRLGLDLGYFPIWIPKSSMSCSSSPAGSHTIQGSQEDVSEEQDIARATQLQERLEGMAKPQWPPHPTKILPLKTRKGLKKKRAE